MKTLRYPLSATLLPASYSMADTTHYPVTLTNCGVEISVASPPEGWESIAKAAPDVLVIASMDRRRFPADDIEAKREFLRSDPVTSEMSAVKNNRIVEMDAHAMSATMRTIYGLESLAEALSTMAFEQ